MADVIGLPDAARAEVVNPPRRGRLPRSVSTVQEFVRRRDQRSLRKLHEQAQGGGRMASTDTDSDAKKRLVRVLLEMTLQAQEGKMTALVWSIRSDDGNWGSGATNVSNWEALVPTRKLASALAKRIADV